MSVLRIFALPLLVVVLSAMILWRFVEPAPPGHITLATGTGGGFYAALGEAYANRLRAAGLDVTLKASAGSAENLRLLRRGEVDAAFVQGGIVRPGEAGLVALGSLAIEPLWLFAPSAAPLDDLAGLTGRRVAAGAEGSGAHALVGELLRDLGRSDAVTLLPLGGDAAATALLNGTADAAVFVTSTDNGAVRRLIEAPGVALQGLRRAEAWMRAYPYLNVVRLPEGGLDLARNVPDRPLDTVGVTTNLVAAEALHPAIAGLLLQVAHAIHDGDRLLGTIDRFPNDRYVELPLHPEAEHYFAKGPSFLQRYFPYWAASLIDRLWVLIIPILTLAIPLFRLAPPAYRWQMGRRIFRWYKDLRLLEREGEAAKDPHARRAVLDRLHRLENDVVRVVVPLPFAERLYHLRTHIAYVKARVEGNGA